MPATTIAQPVCSTENVTHRLKRNFPPEPLVPKFRRERDNSPWLVLPWEQSDIDFLAHQSQRLKVSYCDRSLSVIRPSSPKPLVRI